MSSDGNGFFKGFLLGGAIGAVIALLYAPKSGKEMREDLKRKTEELLEEPDKGMAGAKRKTHQTKRSVRQRTGKAKKAVGAYSEKKGIKTNEAE
jgi:gas vesicle protein